MLKKIAEIRSRIREYFLLKRKSKNWGFKNIQEYLNYCEKTNLETLMLEYNKICEKNKPDFKTLERKVKDVNIGKGINVKQLNVIVESMQNASDKHLNYTDSEVLYNEIVQIFIKKCESIYEDYDYADLFYEMYTLNLEKPIKIKNLVSKYLISVGKVN